MVEVRRPILEPRSQPWEGCILPMDYKGSKARLYSIFHTFFTYNTLSPGPKFLFTEGRPIMGSTSKSESQVTPTGSRIQ